MAITTAAANNKTKPRTSPNTDPSTRSTGANPATVTIFFTNTATKPPANAATMNVTINPTAYRKGSAAPDIGSHCDTSAANHWATKKAATQAASDSISNIKPRHTPNNKETLSTTTKTQSSAAISACRPKAPGWRQANPAL